MKAVWLRRKKMPPSLILPFLSLLLLFPTLTPMIHRFVTWMQDTGMKVPVPSAWVTEWLEGSALAAATRLE
jgi:hypothetical protein